MNNSVKRKYSSFGILSVVTIIAVLIMLITGILVSNTGAGFFCKGWPSCISVSATGWLAFIHRAMVLVSSGFLLSWLILAWRTQRHSPTILTAVTVTCILFLAQALLGGRMVNGFPTYLVVLHQATALATWIALVISVVAYRIEAGKYSQDELVQFSNTRRKALPYLKDLLLLTKPIVVVLLLVTTLAGMVIGLQAWPPFNIIFWTLFTGFLAAGGSGAINQFIDRKDDEKMQRTQKRPIPAGRLSPAEGLAFGAAMTLGSFYLAVYFLNLITALLILAGIIYYVLLYSLILKKTTVQNIVIGGGAGAIPPLVGWAAATGSLNIPALLLFAIVFMWTPPHFWALALVRRKDYARAGVPMLPVVRGEAATQKQILIYTLELVVLTMLLPVFGLGSAIYLVGAGILGIWLIGAAFRVWKHGGNKLAWKMYRYSSMYLALLFLVLMVDRLISAV